MLTGDIVFVVQGCDTSIEIISLQALWIHRYKMGVGVCEGG